MKKNYILIALLVNSIFGYSQNLVYPITMDYNEGLVDIYQNFDIKVTTPTPEQITFQWETISNDMPAGWDISLCDYTDCYSGVPVSGTMTEITLANAQAGIQGFLKLTVGHQGVFGEGTVVMYVYDSNDYNRGDTVSYHLYYFDPLAVDENEASNSFEIFPNPANEYLKINKIGSYSFDIINSLGVVVQTGQSEGTKEINISDLRSGLYFVSIEDGNGNTYSKRLIIK